MLAKYSDRAVMTRKLLLKTTLLKSVITLGTLCVFVGVVNTCVPAFLLPGHQSHLM